MEILEKKKNILSGREFLENMSSDYSCFMFAFTDM